MDIRNRMVDVMQLMCNACQEFLKMVIQPNWQKNLYEIAKQEVENGWHKDNYIAAYEKMRDVGFENYKIEDMDISFITVVVSYCQDIIKVTKATKEAIIKIKNERNLINHSSGNEDAEELYKRGMIALDNLKMFVKTICREETEINDEVRLEYRKKYISEIENLDDKLNEERIELIQQNKTIDKDIDTILNCKNEKEYKKIWSNISESYFIRYFKIEKNLDVYYKFMIKASNKGIKEAHDRAAFYYILQRNNTEAENRLYMLYNSYDILPKYVVTSFVNLFNSYLNLNEGNEITERMNDLIKLISKQGYSIDRNENNNFCLRAIND